MPSAATASARRSIPTTPSASGATADGDELVPVGKAYFGFTDEELLRSTASCATTPSDASARCARWCTSRLVLEVAFEGLQPLDPPQVRRRHALPAHRPPRWDKPPARPTGWRRWDVAALEDLLNAHVAADAPVTQEWISEAELAARPEMVKTMKVKPPVGQGSVRLVRIGEGAATVDLQPCGGTHVRRTGEIGPLRIGKIEKKGRENRRVHLHLAE
jgi:hypothetical protein